MKYYEEIFETTHDIETVKMLVLRKSAEVDKSIAAALRAMSVSYAHSEFLSMMVSKENRAVVKFSQKPTAKELRLLMNTIRAQMETIETLPQQERTDE